ncbi:MAG: hypothetical protein A7316_02180 [Candidatus Altiarchaeales archaeon WOR_SM1_86-2]|nr:MAG: hypothetical protein A7316_02180 [Candidatus Altiarchaeales archaeon WOR_SM1_86-2]
MANKSGTTIAEYTYNFAGKRTIKKEYLDRGVTKTTYYIGRHFEKTIYSNGTEINTSYYYANGERVAKKTSDGTTTKKYFIHPDHLGSTSVITDESGNQVEKTKYYPFGATREGGSKEKYLFTGQEHDSETGLYYYGARYYSPEVRRFVQPDTIVPNPYDPQYLNRYSYVLNNPLIYIDPTGHEISCFGDCNEDIMGNIIQSVIVDPYNEWKGNVDESKTGETGACAVAAFSTAADLISFGLYSGTITGLETGDTEAAYEESDVDDIVDLFDPGSELSAEDRAVGITLLVAFRKGKVKNKDRHTEWTTPRPHLKHPKDKLPTGGDHPYVPPKQKGVKDTDVVKHPDGKGFIDKDGNRWEWSYNKNNPSDPGHWDVQLKDGTHINVKHDGTIHHG